MDRNLLSGTRMRVSKRARRCARWVPLCLLLTAGCADDANDVGVQEAESRSFRRDLVLLDEALTDHDALTVTQIQAFLEETPYGNRSVLADYVSGGVTAAQAIADAASTFRINPVAILTRAQMEQSLIGKSAASNFALNHAMGCGCPDGNGCSSQYRGFHKQAECMASLMRQYLDAQADGGTTVAGWGMGRPRRTLDGYTVVPQTKATAALYTYTPWVASNRAHASIWSRIASHLDYDPPAPGDCPALTFPSGVALQLRPVDALATTSDLSCFLDPGLLYDPEAHVVHPSSVKLANNFRLSEFGAASDTTAFALEPGLVQTLQSMREQLARSISIDTGFTTPDGLSASCATDELFCQAEGLTRGEGIFIRSGAPSTDVVAAAAEAGATSCFRLDDDRIYVGIESPGVGCGID